MTPGRILVTLCLAGALAAGPALADFREIAGTAGYGEKTELPRNAVLEVQLLAVGGEGSAPAPIASVSVRILGAEPYPFRLTYDDAMVEEGQDYALAARISVDGETVFKSAEAVPAFPDWTDDAPHVRMIRPEPERAAPPGLEHTSWTVADMAAGDIAPASRAEIAFREAGKAGGSGGCNSFRTSYRLDPPANLSFGEIESTLRGCSAGLAQQERLVFRALSDTRQYQIAEGGDLVLMAEDGAMLLRLERSR